MATPSEARKLKRELQRHLRRVQGLTERCVGQVCDGDIPRSSRLRAEQHLGMLKGEMQDTLTALDDVETALEQRKAPH